MIVHQAENYIQYIHYNIPKYSVVHNTSSGYIDRDFSKKEIVYFKTVCGSNNPDSWVFFYDIHVRTFDKRVICIIRSNHIKPFVFKAGDPGNYQPNNNGPNIKMKGLYGQSIILWQKQNETLKITNYHTNDVLVETWRAFQLSSAPLIINAPKKTKILPLNPPDEDTSTHACLVSAQTLKKKTE